MSEHPFMPFLRRRGYALLDGGLSTQLERMGYAKTIVDPLWTARVLLESPGALREAHGAFLGAGADCVLSSTYQASPRGLMDQGYSAEEARSLLLKGYEIAREACEAAGRTDGSPAPVAAASLGPYGAYLADGSEYRGDYGLSVEALVDFHRERFELLAPEASVLSFETIPSLDEARAIRILLGERPETYAWVSFSCRDGERIADGTPLVEAASLFDELPQVFAVGVNCTRPEFVTPLVERLVQRGAGKETIVYPNSGETYCAETKRWGEAAGGVSLGELAPRWRSMGARLIGGCCRIGAAELAEAAGALDAE